VSPDGRLENLLRTLAPTVLTAPVRRPGQFDACDDAVQEALLDAATQWPEQGVPTNPRLAAYRRVADLAAARS
jgi:predicted RNA polymerase sigma factor